MPEAHQAFGVSEKIAQQAREWLVRLDSDRPLGIDEQQALHEWLHRSPAHEQELRRLSAFWNEANVLTELSVPSQTPHEAASPKRWGLPRFAAAAVAVCVVFVSLWLTGKSHDRNSIYVTAIGEMSQQILADASRVRLNTDSQIQVDYNADERAVRLLRGEAFFEVEKDSDRSFNVYAGNRLVRAVGTAFAVRMLEGAVEVTVSEGRVDVLHNVPELRQRTAAPAAASLVRGDRVVLRADGTTSLSQLDADGVERELAWREGYLSFKRATLADMVVEVNRYIPEQLVVDDAVAKMRVGGRFKLDDTPSMLAMFEASFGLSSQRIDAQRIRLQRAGK